MNQNKLYGLTQEELKTIISYDEKTGEFKKISSTTTIRLNKRYLQISIKGKYRPLHRLAWFYKYGEVPIEIDHKDHNRMNNKIENLRNVDRSANLKNKSKQKNNTSGFCGVYKSGNKWRARISIDGNIFNIGSYDTKEKAIEARKKEEVKNNFYKNHGKDNIV